MTLDEPIDYWGEEYKPRQYTPLEEAKIADHRLRDLKDGIIAREQNPYKPPVGSAEANMLERLNNIAENAPKPVKEINLEDNDSEEIKTKKRIAELQESYKKGEAARKVQEANFEAKYKEGIRPAPSKSSWQELAINESRQVKEAYANIRAADELKRSEATQAAKAPRSVSIDSGDFIRAENAKNRELQRQYEVKKTAYNQKLAEAAQVKAEYKAKVAEDPTTPKPRFGLGDTNPITQQPWGKINPPGKVWFNKGTHNPSTGKPWATPKPPTSPGGSGIEEMVQKVQRNITQRFNAAKQGIASKQAGGPTSKASSPSATAVSNKPGAEIPHMAVGASVTGMTLSSRAIGIASSGVPLAGAGAALNFGFQVASGVDPARAAFGSVGSFVGGIIGQVAGTVLSGGNPFVGLFTGTAGAYAGQFAGDALYSAIFGAKPKVANKGTNVPKTTASTTNTATLILYLSTPGYSDSTSTTPGNVTATYPVPDRTYVAPYLINRPDLGYNGTDNKVYSQMCNGSQGLIELGTFYPESITVTITGSQNSAATNFYPGLAPGASPPSQAVATSPYTPTTANISSPQKKQAPYAPPKSADLPNESHKRKPLNIAIPAGKSITLTTPDGNSVTVAPSTVPRVINIPRPLPRQLPGGLEPDYDRPSLPLTITSPNAEPIILNTPGTGPVTVSIPGSEPYTFNPASPHNAPLPQSTIKPITKDRSVTLNPTIPGTAPPSTTPTASPSPTEPATKADLNDFLIPLGALGVLLTQIRDRTTPGAIGDAVRPVIAPEVCKTTQPGGCSSNAMNSAANTGSQNTLNGLGVFGQGVDLLLLAKMDAKLGPQMPGGLSSGLGRLSKSLGLDRLLNVLTTVTVLHNAVMLSGSLKVTLLEMLSSLGNATGLLQTSENENIDLNAVLNKGLNELGELIVGEENWDGIKATYKKHNRIYQASANIINSAQGIMNGIANVVSIGAQYTGKIGNALKGNGVIGENSFAWMNEDVSAKTGKLAAFANFGETVGETSELLENVSEASESVVEIQQQATEIVNQNKVFKKTLEDAQKPTSVENKAVKDAEALAKANATATPTGEDAEGLLSFIADN